MPTHLQNHNGLLAKIWLLQCIDTLQESTVDAFFEPYLQSIEPIAEVRDVFHQTLGPVKYFAIEMQSNDKQELFIRGYLDKNSIFQIKECSSSSFHSLDISIFDKIMASLEEVIRKMPTNLPGQLYVKTHISPEAVNTLEWLSTTDFFTLREIVMNANEGQANNLSHALLDQLDLHPNLMEIH
jgi:hypothetical protein